MASDLSFVEYIRDQTASAGEISFKKMFGEYALYCDTKVVAFICDNQVYLKPTSAGRALIPELTEAPPYPGAKLYFLINDYIDDAQFMIRLVESTAKELPLPKPKLPKPKK
jgi:TfoX/Sxy family transcriptional regulator of competence genes